MASTNTGGKGGRKFGRNKNKPSNTKYRTTNRRAINKARKIKAHEEFHARKAAEKHGRKGGF